MYDKKWETSEVGKYTVIKKISTLFLDLFSSKVSEDTIKNLMVK